MKILIILFSLVLSFYAYYNYIFSDQFFISAGLALLTAYGIHRLLKLLIKMRNPTVEALVGEAALAADAYKNGMKILTEIRGQTRMITNNDVAKKIQDICRIGIEIFEDIKKNPNDLKKARMFINYYLETTEKIVTRYIDLSKRKDLTDEMKKTLGEVEGTLDSIKDTFQKQLSGLLVDDILDINAELNLLKKTMKMEG